MPGLLSVVATPIGNMDDLTFRAVRTLEEADAIACEDTRVTVNILTRYTLSKKPLISLHHHSDEKKIAHVIAALASGQQIAYVSDAGTPGVNDPGGKLVAAAVAAGITVTPIPGASAVTAAISVCGFPMERFTYVGFIPQKKGRQALLADIADRSDATVFLESTHRIEKTLDALAKLLHADRQVYVGRELTKKFETHLRGTIAEVREQLGGGSVKGEFIVIVASA